MKLSISLNEIQVLLKKFANIEVELRSVPHENSQLTVALKRGSSLAQTVKANLQDVKNSLSKFSPKFAAIVPEEPCLCVSLACSSNGMLSIGCKSVLGCVPEVIQKADCSGPISKNGNGLEVDFFKLEVLRDFVGLAEVKSVAVLDDSLELQLNLKLD